MIVSTQTSLSIRTMQLEDLSDIATLLSHSFYPTRGFWAGFLPLLRTWTYQDLQSRFYAKISQYQCLVGIQTVNGTPHMAEQIVGSIEVAMRPLSLWSLSSSPVPYISNLAVDNRHRRQGIARQLLLACEPVVGQWGCDQIYLHALETNTPALKLYANVDYQVQQPDSHWSSALLGQPRRLLLRKKL